MIIKEMYIDKQEGKSFKNMMDTVAFDDEIMFYYKNYTEKMKEPDLFGKTVKVNDNQFPNIYKIVKIIANKMEIEIPNVFIYEDFYYGIESKGATKPWIEISAKTLSDLTEEEITFLIAREMCEINLRHTYYYTMINEVLEAIDNRINVIGSDSLHKYWKAIMYKWARIANYTADNFGYLMCGSLTVSISAIKKLILNNCYLADNMNLLQYIKQGEEINYLNDDIHNFAKLDELVPYGPFRIKNLINFASSSQGIEAIKKLQL